MNEQDKIIAALLDVVKSEKFNAVNPSDLHALIYLLYYQMVTQSLLEEDIDLLIQIVQTNLINPNMNEMDFTNPEHQNNPPIAECQMCPPPHREIRFKALGFDPPEYPEGLAIGPSPFYFPQDPNGNKREFGKSFIPFSVAKMLVL